MNLFVKFDFNCQAKTLVKRMSSKELVLQFDRSQLAAINRFRQRGACWDLTKRGEVGETALHLCLLNNTEMHLTIASIMLEMYPKMVLDIYEENDYYGNFDDPTLYMISERVPQTGYESRYPG